MKLHLFPITLALLTTTAIAQVQKVEDLTTWTHTSATGDTWKDDQTQAGSKAAKVDILTSGKSMQFSSSAIVLDAGTYVFTARIMKMTNTTGIAPITARVISTGIDKTSTMWAVQQKVDAWDYTPSVAFTLKKKQPVLITVGNTDTSVTKQNYAFDQALIGKVPEGDCLYYHSMTHRTVRSVHGSPYHYYNTANTASAFGEVNRLAGVWWLEFRSWQTVTVGTTKVRAGNRYVLQPGTYTWNVRLQRNSTSTSGSAIFRRQMWINGTVTNHANWTPSIPANTWVVSPNVSFVITKKDSVVDFRLMDIASTYKTNYLFDALLVREGAFDAAGTGCSTKNGTATLSGDPGRAGCSITMRATNLDTSVIFAAGAPLGSPVALGGGCTLYITPTYLVAMAATGTSATLKIDLPNLSFLKGLNIGAQAATNGPSGAIATTNWAKVVIG